MTTYTARHAATETLAEMLYELHIAPLETGMSEIARNAIDITGSAGTRLSDPIAALYENERSFRI